MYQTAATLPTSSSPSRTTISRVCRRVPHTPLVRTNIRVVQRPLTVNAVAQGEHIAGCVTLRSTEAVALFAQLHGRFHALKKSSSANFPVIIPFACQFAPPCSRFKELQIFLDRSIQKRSIFSLLQNQICSAPYFRRGDAQHRAHRRTTASPFSRADPTRSDTSLWRL